MNKKDVLLPFLFIGLSLAFLFFSGMVYLSKRKPGRWISGKMKTGALLLSLTALTTTGCRPKVMCYDVAASDVIRIEGAPYGQLELKLSQNPEIKGTINYRTLAVFSYRLMDSHAKQTILAKEIVPEDGKFDNQTEIFSIKIDPSLKPGNFRLFIYNNDLSKQDENHYNIELKLHLVD